MITRSLIHAISIAFITLSTQSVFSETLTAQESDLLTKEDIAATQVLAEVCPSLLNNNSLFKSKIDGLIQTSLKQLSKPTTLEQLKQDEEYMTLLKEAQQDAKEVDQAEQNATCADVLSI